MSRERTGLCKKKNESYVYMDIYGDKELDRFVITTNQTCNENNNKLEDRANQYTKRKNKG